MKCGLQLFWIISKNSTFKSNIFCQIYLIFVSRIDRIISKYDVNVTKLLFVPDTVTT
jgi:hypothetical protein